MTFANKFREIVTGYLVYLQEGGTPVQLEHKPRRHLEGGLVHASNLMDCPLKDALSRRNVPAKFPELLNVNRPTALMRMLQGNKVGEILQEAMIWGMHDERLEAAFVEEYFINRGMSLQGQIDITVVQFDCDGILDIVEIKHRLPNWQGKPQPRMGDVFQLFAYMHDKAGVLHDGHLVILDTPAYKEYGDPEAAYEVWTLEPDGDGYKLISEHGYAWKHNLNHGGYINEVTLREEIAKQLRYANDASYILPPFSLSDEDAWQCRNITVKAKNGNAGIMVPACAHWCHCEDVPETGLKYQEIDGRVELMWEF